MDAYFAAIAYPVLASDANTRKLLWARSEQWKENVLRGQALRTLPLKDFKAGRHTLAIKALDAHIVVDQWMVQLLPVRKAYLFPIAEK